MHKFSAWTHVSNFEQSEHENRTKSVTNGMKSMTNGMKSVPNGMKSVTSEMKSVTYEWPWWEKPKATAFPRVKTGWIFASGVNQWFKTRFIQLLVDKRHYLWLVFSDVILVTSRSLLLKKNNAACYIQGKWGRGEELLTVHFLKVARRGFSALR